VLDSLGPWKEEVDGCSCADFSKELTAWGPRGVTEPMKLLFFFIVLDSLTYSLNLLDGFCCLVVNLETRLELLMGVKMDDKALLCTAMLGYC